MRYIVATFLGVVAGLAFQTYLPLIIIFPVLVWMFLMTLKVRRATWVLSWVVFGFFQFFTGLFWLEVVGIDIVVIVSLFCLTSFFASALLTCLVKNEILRTTLFVLTLCVFENIRDSFPFGGFGWLQYGMILVDTPLSVLHRILPQLLMTLLVLASAALVAMAFRNLLSRKVQVSFSLLIVLLVLCSAINLVHVDTSNQFNIIAIQGGVERYGLGVLGNRTEVLENHIQVTKRNLAAVNQADVVVWPENSLDIDPKLEPKAGILLDEIDSLVKPPILLGSVLSPTSTTRSNTTLELNNEIKKVYTKQRLVPFGEFLPFREFATSLTDRAALLPYDFISGATPGSWKSGNFQMSIGICFEVADAYLLHQNIANSDLVLIQTNNATYQFSNQSEQQLLYAKIRSIETGRPLLSISTSGLSALIINGRTMETIAKGKTGSLNFSVAHYSGKTITSILVPIAGWLVCVVWIGAMAMIFRKQRK